MIERQAVDAKRLPKFNMSVVNRSAANIEEAMLVYEGRVVSPDEFHEFVRTIGALLPLGAIKPQLECTLTPFTIEPVTADNAKFAARRLAGNVPAFRLGLPVSLIRDSAPDGWCYVRVVEVERVLVRSGVRYKVVMFAESGPWAGAYVSMTVSREYIRFIAVHAGFGKWKSMKKLRYNGPRDLSGMRLTVLVITDQEETRFGPSISDFGVSGAQKKLNRDIIKGRNSPCPLKVVDGDGLRIDCIRCEKGREVCKFSCRELSLVRMMCSVCNKEHLHDLLHQNACISCRLRHLEKRIEECGASG